MSAEHKTVLARAQAALRRERKFLRMAMAAQLDVQVMLDALLTVGSVPVITPIADDILRGAGFQPPAEPDGAPIESKPRPQSPSDGTAAAVGEWLLDALRDLTPSALIAAFDGTSGDTNATAAAARVRWEMSAAKSRSRPISVTALRSGETVLDIGDEKLHLSEQEARALRAALSRSADRSPSRTGRGCE